MNQYDINNHTLILGFGNRILEIIRELIEANDSEPDAAIVILAEDDKEYMDNYDSPYFPFYIYHLNHSRHIASLYKNIFFLIPAMLFLKDYLKNIYSLFFLVKCDHKFFPILQE